MTITLTSQQLQIIKTGVEKSYPQEGCGLLLGHLVEGNKIVIKAIATENSWDATAASNFAEVTGKPQREVTRRTNFSIAPEVMLRVQKQARDEKLEIVGIYHSHPDGQAIPSEFDRAIAWPIYSYLIVSVQNGKSTEVLSWVLDEERQFQPETLLSPP
ncbi:MAG: M67 family metallopeptidase [Jaaginema sp. PMC 1079.18]|nr:M67 family metallopeptidase [Jaaginema sp. PMC 1080.18]MEC4852074.1 M67 family metallopeptidase [Jaaginema sp. PMC 1079.18]MEC4867254.1 M67 family metallopeptidase [Jaaginema sp. PMC 1078.18]